MNKILIKSKKLDASGIICEEDTGCEEEEAESVLTSDHGMLTMAFPVVPDSQMKRLSITNPRDYTDDGTAAEADVQLDGEEDIDMIDGMSVAMYAYSPPKAAPKSKEAAVAQELSDLVTYCQAKRFESFEKCVNTCKFRFYHGQISDMAS